MSIYLGSRYEDSTVDFVAFTQEGDAAPVVFYAFSDLGLISYSEYTWKNGDRLDSVAMRFYGNPEKWWLIPEYNPQLTDIQNIPSGTVLRIANV